MSPRRDHGQALYALLPIVYRTRDEHGDLERLLAACGVLLDRIGETLDQRLADCFPDPDGGPDGQGSQAWLLPYFADLVDARLRSPHVAGRRREVAQAIEWRQKKGTLGAAESIAEAVVGRGQSGLGGREVELREGFRLAATTATFEGPLGDSTDRELHTLTVTPGTGPRRPASTVRVDLPSRAVRVDVDTPGARRSSFRTGGRISWAVLHPDGVPCFLGAFDDVARRTVDVRTPSAVAGHAHARRVLAHVAPPLGFFEPGHSERRGAPSNRSAAEITHVTDTLLERRDEHIGTLVVNAGRVRLHGCTVDRLETKPGTLVSADGCVLGAVDAGGTVRLRHTTVTGALKAGVLTGTNSLLDAAEAERARLQRCTVRSLATTGESRVARTLIDELKAKTALLEYATVLGKAKLTASLAASDTLFAGTLTAPAGAARYSRVPAGVTTLRTHAVTTATPRFLAGWAQPGCGVLDAGSPAAIRFGAEDGGEIGAYHDDAHGLEDVALRDQLADHLPYGLEPVLVPDLRLHQPPPALTPTSETR